MFQARQLPEIHPECHPRRCHFLRPRRSILAAEAAAGPFMFGRTGGHQ
jgi:hypothetical protein